MTVTKEQLLAIMPRCPPERFAEGLVPALNVALVEAQCTTLERKAAFLAQLAHECAEFQRLEEQATGDAYEVRVSIGNTLPGDGRRFKGRGPIQLTGRYNYRRAGRALQLALERKPEWVAKLDVGLRVAAWYWRTHRCNEAMDAGDFGLCTERINGRKRLHQAQRERYYRKALTVLQEVQHAA